jgi:hypothetical protein
VAILRTEHYSIYAFLIGLAEYDLWKISSAAYFPIHFIMILSAMIGSIYAKKMASSDWSEVVTTGAA